MIENRIGTFWSPPLVGGSRRIFQQLHIITIALLLLATQNVEASTKHYFMNNRGDCSMQGFIDVPSNVRITVTLRGTAQTYTAQRCLMKFQAQNTREYIKVEFTHFYIGACTVSLEVGDNTFTCDARPATRLLDSRAINLVLNKNLDDNQYDGDIIISAYSKDFSDFRDEESNPVLIGIIIGVVCAIILIILLIAICGHCYYKSLRKKQKKAANCNGNADDIEQTSRGGRNNGIGYVIEGSKNGGIIKNNNSPKNNDRSLLSPDDEVKQFYDDYIDENKKNTTTPIIDNLANSPKKLEFEKEKGSEMNNSNNPTPKSPVLSALHNSPKFMASYKSTEAEAEERAKRISQVSTLPPTPPPLPTVPSSPQMQRSQAHTNHTAGIRRVPKISASSEDMEHLEREISAMEAENKANQILPLNIPTNPTLSSSVGPRAVQIATQPLDQPLDHERQSSKDSGGGNNQHTLRPSRAPQDKKKSSTDTVDGGPPSSMMPVRPPPQKTNKEKDSGSNSLRKRGGHKIPKFPKGRQLTSDTESSTTAYPDDRSDTPLSEVSSRMARTDDNESLPPLQRTTSRQSLFASRTSLYGRHRGKGRERRPSVTESVTSYAHDDLDMYIPSSSHPDPMDRRDARIFKSMGDITKAPPKDNNLPPYPEQTKKNTSKNKAHKKPANTRKSSSSTQTIEAKGTQTDTSQKKSSQCKGTGGTSAASSKRADPVQPPLEMSKSQFQPISKADVVSNNQYLEDLPKPTKSPWELLCELTDAEMKMRNGSDSLPAGNLPPMYNSSDYAPSSVGQSRPSIDNLPAAYHPSISSQVSDRESYAPAYSPPATVSYQPPPPLVAASNLPPNNLYPRKSSWEALKELTDNQLSYPSDGASESIV